MDGDLARAFVGDLPLISINRSISWKLSGVFVCVCDFVIVMCNGSSVFSYVFLLCSPFSPSLF